MSSDLPAILAQLPALSAKHSRIWDLIQAEEPAPRMRHALRLVLAGATPSRAAAEAGFPEGSRRLVYDRAKHWDIYQPKAERIRSKIRDLTDLTVDHMITKVIRDPDSIDPRALPNWARLGQAHEAAEDAKNATSSIDQLVAKLVEHGASLHLSVSVPDPASQAIDVQPIADEHPNDQEPE